MTAVLAFLMAISMLAFLQAVLRLKNSLCVHTLDFNREAMASNEG
jgi:hypothetical protein